MRLAQPFRLLFLFAMALLVALPPPARALQLGETHEQLVARHGAPNDEDHARHVATYFWDGWSAQLEFRSGVVSRITYKRDWYLQDSDIASLLGANGGAARWSELTGPGDKTRLWARDDGAAASCMASHPLNMVFEAGPDTPKAQAPQNNAAPVILPPLPVADRETPSPIPPTPSVDTSAPAASTPVTPAPAAESRPAPANPETHAIPFGTLAALALGALLGVGGASFVFFKRRPPSANLRQLTPAATLPALPPAVRVPRLPEMPVDQLEMLLSGMFRRSGYRTELPSDLAAERDIELTLRNDSESILAHYLKAKPGEATEDDIRVFLHAVTAAGATRGILMAPGHFSVEARRFAEENGIEILDGNTLERRLSAGIPPALMRKAEPAAA